MAVVVGVEVFTRSRHREFIITQFLAQRPEAYHSARGGRKKGSSLLSIVHNGQEQADVVASAPESAVTNPNPTSIQLVGPERFDA